MTYLLMDKDKFEKWGNLYGIKQEHQVLPITYYLLPKES